MTGKDMKQLRKNRKLSETALADLLEVSRSSVVRYESMDELPRWLVFAVSYAIGTVTVQTVTVTRTKKVVNAPGLRHIQEVGERKELTPMRSRLKPKLVDVLPFTPSFDDGVQY